MARALLLGCLLMVGCSEDPEPGDPGGARHDSPEMGPCAPVLITGCGECLSECEQLSDYGDGHYAQGDPEGSMGAPPDAYELGEHCIEEDCRPVYTHRIRQCYGLCRSRYEGWVECAIRAGRCETVSQPRP